MPSKLQDLGRGLATAGDVTGQRQAGDVIAPHRREPEEFPQIIDEHSDKSWPAKAPLGSGRRRLVLRLIFSAFGSSLRMEGNADTTLGQGSEKDSTWELGFAPCRRFYFSPASPFALKTDTVVRSATSTWDL